MFYNTLVVDYGAIVNDVIFLGYSSREAILGSGFCSLSTISLFCALKLVTGPLAPMLHSRFPLPKTSTASHWKVLLINTEKSPFPPTLGNLSLGRFYMYMIVKTLSLMDSGWN